MRKIEQWMIDKIEGNTLGLFCKDNTTVSKSVGVVEVKLHNHLIYRKDTKGTFISMAGWGTRTTRSRLNALGSSLFPRFCTFQSKHCQHLETVYHAKFIDPSKWYQIKDGQILSVIDKDF